MLIAHWIITQIKLYLDNMKQFLNDVACMPSVLGSSTNIANI